ncbi:sirohydrochlorin chelatase [Jeotgalibacillus marinus]|uniref:Sirohydrochlorin chelatase n=1 Tax=Jeotgalibacillus marinus TaxID=86667 RepID=A0ABV3PZ08_9BACL
MKAILYVSHGTRSKQGAEEVRRFLESVIDLVEVPIQEISFLELTKPFIGEGFEQCVNRGATEISVVPLFLLAAGHIKKDIPDSLIPLRKKYPHIKVKVAPPFSVQDRILNAIGELVRSVVHDVNLEDSILIVGRGSSDLAIHDAFTRISRGIKEKLGVRNIQVCYLAAASPTFTVGLETIIQKARGERVIVVPYLLFPGLLLSEIIKEVNKRRNQGQSIVHTGPLSSHRVIKDIVIDRALG